jgi:tight adherence protein C
VRHVHHSLDHQTEFRGLMSETLKIVIAAGGGAALLVLVASLLLAGEAAQRDLSRRVQHIASGGATGGLEPVRNAGNLLLAAIRRIGATFQATSLFSQTDIAALERSAVAAGLNPQRTVPIVIGGKVVLMLGCPALVFIGMTLAGYTSLTRLVVAMLTVALAMFGPNWTLQRFRKSRLAALRRGLPDALDLMVVCAEAGLGLETVVDRVSAELRAFSPAIAMEFNQLGQDMRLSSDRGMALARMAERTEIESFQQLSGTLSQTLRYGTPLGQALRVLAVEMRNERLMRLEEKAARLPVLLTIPLTLFIFPCLFIVVCGPVVIKVLNIMHP